MQKNLLCFSSLRLPCAKGLVFFLADVHLKVGAKMSEAVEIDIFCSILKQKTMLPMVLLQDFKQVKQNETSSVFTI